MGLSQIAATLSLIGVPFALSAGTAFLTGALRRHRSITTIQTAGEWLTGAVSVVPGLRCGVSPELAGDADGYWPHAKTITLAANTWRGVDADAQAIAAHELGHAIEHHDRPMLADRLALARRMNGVVTQTFVASALITVLFAAPTLLPIVGISLLLSVTLGTATLIEEALASRAAHRWLASHEPRTDVRKRVTFGLLSAFGIYASEWLGRAALLVVGLLYSPWFVAGEPLALTVDAAWLGWAVFFLTPILALHAGATLIGAIQSPVADTEFRLAWTSQREATWEFHAALVILVWATLAALHPWSRPYAPLVVLAAIPAMGPLTHLGRGMALVPVIAAWAVGAHIGLWGDGTRPLRGRTPRPIPATQLAVLHEDGLTRLGRLLRVAYVPLALVWTVRFMGG